MENTTNNRDRLRVLIADDVQETRRSTRLMMTLLPELELVAIAHNGRQAVEMAQEKNPDIALLDVKMPEMDGLQATQAMLDYKPELVCIILSAERDNKTLHQAIAAGARGYLIKPFTADQFQQTIKKMADRIRATKQRARQTDKLRMQRDTFLLELAKEYVKARRTDDKALEVFEQLAEDPACELRWLRHLAMIYVLRAKWAKLKGLASRLEGQEKPT